jgi:hypothetical protein
MRILSRTILSQEGESGLNECIRANPRYILPVAYPYQAVLPGAPKALPVVCLTNDSGRWYMVRFGQATRGHLATAGAAVQLGWSGNVVVRMIVHQSDGFTSENVSHNVLHRCPPVQTSGHSTSKTQSTSKARLSLLIFRERLCSTARRRCVDALVTNEDLRSAISYGHGTYILRGEITLCSMSLQKRTSAVPVLTE